MGRLTFLRIELSPATYRRITFVAAVLLAVIIVTGAAVRLTKSGLGCPVGISCPSSQLQAHGPASEHATIEHVNRLFTGLVSVAVIVAVLGSLVRNPKRKDLTRLSLGLVAGVFAQAILGQLTVEFDLKPQFVMAHFLVSIVLLSNAILLMWRAGLPDAPAHAIVSRRTVLLGRLLLGLAAAVLFTGTIVTGAGAHSGGGTKDNVARLGFRVPDVARVHSGVVLVFLAVVLATLWLVRHDRPPASVQRRVALLLAVLVAQAGVGYAQYFSDIPPLLVGFHIAGATAVWSATLALYLGLFDRTDTRPATSPAPDASPPLLAGVT